MTEAMDLDVLIIGGGTAGLSAAYHLANLVEQYRVSEAKDFPELMIGVLEKGSEMGAHSFSGAVLNPIALKEMIPDFEREGAPIESPVVSDSLHYLTETANIQTPWIPPSFQNHGNYLVSIAMFNRWLAEKAEAKGVNLFPGFSAVEVLYGGENKDQVIGVRTGDKGRDKAGQPKSNFESGMIINAKVVIFAEGSRGSLFKSYSIQMNFFEKNTAEVFEEGVKEIIQMPPGTVTPGQVIHTFGFPLSKSIGGAFLYTLSGDRLALGLVTYMDSKDPLMDPHRELQRLKSHPFIYQKIKGGQVIAYGGKTLPAGGWYSMPTLAGKGWIVCGDSAAMVNVKKLKGLHLAMKSGMLAAETILEGLKQKSWDEYSCVKYSEKVHSSYIKKELYEVRNFHQTLSMGLPLAFPLVALQELTGGRGLWDQKKFKRDAQQTEKVMNIWGPSPWTDSKVKAPAPDGKLFFDKLSSVYLTGTQHEENSPCHLIVKNKDVCRSQCDKEYQSPCVHFCPAQVYEMHSGNLQVNFTNCIHCKSCDIKCPFENIDWTPPEGGGGPNYRVV